MMMTMMTTMTTADTADVTTDRKAWIDTTSSILQSKDVSAIIRMHCGLPRETT